MIITFCKKNEEFYKEYNEYDDFIYPSEKEIIAQYTSIDIIDRPCVGDSVRVKGEIYKVFKILADYDRKEIIVVVEKPSLNEIEPPFRFENLSSEELGKIIDRLTIPNRSVGYESK